MASTLIVLQSEMVFLYAILPGIIWNSCSLDSIEAMQQQISGKPLMRTQVEYDQSLLQKQRARQLIAD